VRGLLGWLLVFVLALAAVGGGLLLLQSRDDAEVGGAPTGPGERVTDRCPARTAPVTRDRRKLSRDQIQTALARGNVVIAYAERPAPELRRLQRDSTGGAFDAEIAAAGQAVILAENGVRSGYEARAWGRRLAVDPAEIEQLQEFTDAWLGEGAPKPCPS
jgi:hypothetical protein